MAFLDRFRRAAQDSPREIRAADFSGFIAPRYATYADAYGKTTTEGAVSNTIGVYACVSFVAEVFGSLPLHLYREGENGRERIRPGDADRSLPGVRYPGSLAKIIGELPNPEMTAQTLWETAFGHGSLWGTAYLNVQRVNGRVAALWPLHPGRIRRKRDDAGRLYYEYLLPTGDGTYEVRILYPSDVMRVPWFGMDGLSGVSQADVASRSLGILQGSERFLDSWYANSAVPSSIVTIPKGPQEKFKERAKVYRDELQRLHGGMDNAGRLAVVEEGVTWSSPQMTLESMQLIEMRKYQLADLCRLWRLPQYLFDPEKTSSWGSGVEQQWIGMLTTTGRPLLRRFEGGMNKDLGPEPGVKTLRDEGIYPEFLAEDLLRTDVKTRYTAYGVAIANRIMSPAYVAELENLPYDAGRPADYENPNTTAPEAPAEDPAPLALVENDRVGALEAEVRFLSTRAASTQHIEVTVPERETHIDVRTPDIHIDPADVTVNVPTQPVPDAPVVNVNMPDDRPRTRVVERDADSNITRIRDEITEEA